MSEINELTSEELTEILSYTGLILIAFELIKSIIVAPIKAFYLNVTLGNGMSFKSYEEDVLSRHKNEFQACLLYLCDFMEAIDSDDILVIQELREHRNDLAHNIAQKLQDQDVKCDIVLLEKVKNTLFKLSNYRTYMKIGSDPELQNKGIDWESIKGHEYIIFEEVINKIKELEK